MSDNARFAECARTAHRSALSASQSERVEARLAASSRPLNATSRNRLDRCRKDAGQVISEPSRDYRRRPNAQKIASYARPGRVPCPKNREKRSPETLTTYGFQAVGATGIEPVTSAVSRQQPKRRNPLYAMVSAGEIGRVSTK